ncbi:hypothetical protein [Streptomyces sp. NPDC085540]|uniref:effector-associated constant component EACC1 n=1 Tax=Streptomyces sp. NPDC085540 TaxID=3365730 RepID=UPI0037D0578C
MTHAVEITHRNGSDALEELRIFLVRDPEVRRLGRVRWGNPAPKAGELGDGLDVLTLVITSLLALPGFIYGVSSWVKSRGSDRDDVEIRLGTVTVTVSGTEDPAQIRQLAELLKTAYPEETPHGDGQ